MEGFVARWYTKTAQKQMEEFRRHARLVAEQLPDGGSVLDLAPGPGLLALELARLGRLRVTGLDVSETFVRIATEKAKEAGVAVDFRRGNAARMPFDDGTFDGVVCRAAFKNFADPVGALNETYRVLKPGGKALILDLRKDAPIEAINEHVRQMHLSWLNAFITRLIFRLMLLKRAYTNADFERFVAATKFSRRELRENGIEWEVWLSK
jgi:ubiquinone/menaquinone biosynthesis C-methylase UbiE